MREKLNSNPMAQVGLIAVLLVLAAVFAMTQMGGGEEEEESAGTAPSPAAATAGPAVLPPPGALAATAPPPPRPVTAAFASGQTVVLLFVRNGGIDDRMVAAATRRGIVVITSENFDGEWIAGIITRFGYGTARGSTSRGGSRALIRMKRDMDAGKPTAFTLDGPRGPARVAQAGAVWLSKATGAPVLK